ncbi:MAG: hypothetical protein ACI4PF_00955 [Christensenellales bacterium]
MGTLLKYEIGRRNFDHQYHWQKLNIVDKSAENYFQITKPAIICLGGNHTAKAINANSLCRTAESLMGVKLKTIDNELATFDDVDIIGISYGLNLEKKFKKDGSRAPICDFSDEEFNEIINSLFLPLFTNETGSRLPVEIAKKNFSQITFFTYCYGAFQLYELIDEVKLRLEGLGYSKDEINSIMSDSRQVSYAPWTDARNLPTIAFKSLQDTTTNFGKKHYLEHKDSVNGIKVYYNAKDTQGQFIYPKAQTSSIEVISSKLINENDENVNEHSLDLLERYDDDWTLCDNRDSKNADAISQMAGYALSESVARSLRMYYDNKYIPNRDLIDVTKDLEKILLNFNDNDLIM